MNVVSLLSTARQATEAAPQVADATEPAPLFAPKDLSREGCKGCRMLHGLCEFHRGVTAALEWVEQTMREARSR